MNTSMPKPKSLFDISDFQLFDDYQGKYQRDYPDAYDRLKKVYDKLGDLASYLDSKGFPKSRMLRKPTNLQQQYTSYHWSKICFPELFDECDNKVFFVVGTSSVGLYLEINYNENDGSLYCSAEADIIRKESYTEIPQTWEYTLEELANICIDFFNQNKKQFLLFAKEFRIKKAIKMLNKMDIDEITGLLFANRNIILTGAPGTGKTFLAKQIAQKMLFGEIKEQLTEEEKNTFDKHCGFVQFHPSYDYTDFVEGLRPKKEGNSLGFQRKDGVFKEFCRRALKEAPSIEEAYKYLWDKVRKKEIKQLAQYGPNQVTQEMEVKEDSPNTIYFLRKNGDFNIDTSVTLNKVKTAYYDRGIKTLEHLKSLGAPDRKMFGTQSNESNTWAVMNYLLTLLEKRKSGKPFVFIIDEINRGEISKIFGELFYSIDPGYRGEKGKVNTQYQNLIPKDPKDEGYNPDDLDEFRYGFYVPENVYIIGTMNDIDRSVESMDFAIRRRFAWKEITAKSRQSMLDDPNAWKPYVQPSQSIIAEIKNRMNNLNDCIVDKNIPEGLSSKDKIGLTEAYHIGGSYFLKYGLYQNFDELWDNHLKGLLYEYLRGTTNIEAKIDRLKNAYNDTVAH